MDLPTLGKPTRPTSASSFSSSWTSSSSPGVPGLANRGTCRVGVAKWVLPQPPLPPLAMTWGSSAGHIRQQAAGLGVLDQGAAGHGDHQVRGAFAKAAVAPAVLSPLGGVLALVAEIRQGGEVVVHLEHNAAAPAAVAPIGTAGGHVLFPVEGDGAVAPIPGFDFDFRGIDEHSAVPFPASRKRLLPAVPEEALSCLLYRFLTRRTR